ncbi:hypothetical protein [Wolbachia pipientis]|nr:hypothetical protein [Wolbachia pipientis]
MLKQKFQCSLSCHPSVTHWNDIVYYVPYCNVRTVVRGIDSANK